LHKNLVNFLDKLKLAHYLALEDGQIYPEEIILIAISIQIYYYLQFYVF